MAHITGEDRSQLLLLPDTVDDYVGPDNPVRFIDAFENDQHCRVALRYGPSSHQCRPSIQASRERNSDDLEATACR